MGAMMILALILGVVVFVVLFRRLGALGARITVLEQKLTDQAGEQAAAPRAARENPQEGLSAAQTQPASAPPIASAKNLQPGKATAPKTNPRADIPASFGIFRDKTAPVARIVSDETRRPLVFNARNQRALATFVSNYWAYILGALSMMLAGIYMVRWGIERDLISPWARVGLALFAGLVLIGFAERLRQRFGDGVGSATAYIPSIFAASGFAAIYGALVGAVSLYGLINVNAGLIALAMIAIFAVIAGRIFGLLLSALGALGAYLAPVIIGEASPLGYAMFVYALMILAIVLIVDSARRSAWLSVWGMVLCAGFAALVYFGRPNNADAEIYAVSLMAFGLFYLVLIAVVPERNVTPRFGLVGRKYELFFPDAFPARMIFGAQIVVIAAFVAAIKDLPSDSVLAVVLFLSVCIGIYFFWFRQAPALLILPIVPIGLMLFWMARVFFAPFNQTGNFAGLLAGAEGRSLVFLGVILSLVTALYSYRVSRLRRFWAWVSIAFPVVFVVSLWLVWQVAPTENRVIWYWVFGFFGINSAALFDHHRRLRGLSSPVVDFAALPLLIYIVLIGALLPWRYALLGAVTFATLWAIWVGRRNAWPLHSRLGRYGGLAMAGLFSADVMFTLGADVFGRVPIADWYLNLAIGGAIIAIIFATYQRLDQRDAPLPIYFESAGFLTLSFWAIGAGYFALVVLWGYEGEIALLGLYFLAFFAQFLALRHRIKNHATPSRVRQFGQWFYGLIAGLFLGQLIGFNPLSSYVPIMGKVIVNDLLIAYLLPALAIMLAARRGYLGVGRKPARWAAAALVVFWLALNIRMFWQGNEIYASKTATQGELFSYSLLLIIAMAAAMAGAIKRNSMALRRLALVLLLALAAKIYFIDLAQFETILRIAALFLLGLVLIGFSLIDRKTPITEAHMNENAS